jgi:hypothetical protein
MTLGICGGRAHAVKGTMLVQCGKSAEREASVASLLMTLAAPFVVSRNLLIYLWSRQCQRLGEALSHSSLKLLCWREALLDILMDSVSLSVGDVEERVDLME